MRNFILITGCLLLSVISLQAQVTINRYAESKISETGIAGKIRLQQEVIIPAIDHESVKRKWKDQQLPKFAERITTDIDPVSRGQWERDGQYSINRVKITAEKAKSIAICFDRLALSPNAELYIYNPQGTVITGPVTSKENTIEDRVWTSNVFNGSSLIIELKSPASEEKLNRLHIRNILYGVDPRPDSPFPSKDSLSGPGFGNSTSCNINAVCVAGWSQEMNAVAQVVDGGSGLWSAALVMNTCNTRKPYILTAYHCVVQSGSQINTNNCTFEFLWYSSTCTPTTNTTSTLLYNGATVRALWVETDMALLELNQSVSSSSGLSFLGWSRSATAPTSSVGIHHPAGDIMKIAVENSTATVGQILTYPNMAWRVVWDQGTVNPGSSGSPLFDANNRLVIGQSYSNTQPTTPPCNQQTGGSNYGRFDISWTGGGTNGSRLSNWLDPSGINVSSISTTNASSLSDVSPSLTVNGSSSLCGSTETYTLSGAPGGSTIIWESSNPTIASMNSSTGVLTKNVTYGTQVTVTAKVYVNGGLCFSANKVVTVGRVSVSSVSPIMLYSGPGDENEICRFEEVIIDLDVSPGGSPSWSLLSWTGGPQPSWSDMGDNLYLYFFKPNQQTAIFRLSVTNACGSDNYDFGFISIDCGFRFMVTPNPVTSDLQVSAINKGDVIKEIRITDKMGMVKKVVNYRAVTSSAVINMSSLPPDIYIVQVFDGKTWASKKIVKQ